MTSGTPVPAAEPSPPSDAVSTGAVADSTPTTAAPNPAPANPATPKPAQYDLGRTTDLIQLFSKESDDEIKRQLIGHIKKILTNHGLESYTTLMLYDNCDSLTQFHANAIYEAASDAKKKNDILLILQSGGGSIEAAYLISKTCARLTKTAFVVAVPRRAKSAATLLALGADQIHMGLMSELGPVDPQIEGYPALGLINSLNVIAEIACKHPESAEVLARYLSRKLDLRHLGYYARVPESAVQYAERLLKRNEAQLPKGTTAHSIADHFVNHYKDHGFVIDLDEASQLLGAIVRNSTPEYKAANEIYGCLDLVERYARLFKKKEFWYVGNIESGIALWRDYKA